MLVLYKQEVEEELLQEVLGFDADDLVVACLRTCGAPLNDGELVLLREVCRLEIVLVIVDSDFAFFIELISKYGCAPVERNGLFKR